jgi:hypothetical protein
MKKNVVISLTDSAELLLTLKVFSGLKHAYRNASWSLITWSEYREIVGLYGHVDEVHYVNRETIKRVLKSPVYPNSFAINTLWDELSECIKSEYHWVINFSNNELGGYLASALKKEHQSGLHFDQFGSVNFNDIWSRYTNEVFTIQAQSFNRYDLLRFMCGLENENMPMINIDDRAKKSLAGKFLQIREQLASKKQDKKIIGFDVDGFIQEDNNSSQLAEVIFALVGSKEFAPIFLVKKNHSNQIALLKKLSASLEINLYVVEYETKESLSMLMHLDALIAKGGLLKQLAHYSDTPTLTIKQQLISNTGYSYCANDLILEASIESVAGDDVISSLDMLLFGKIRKGHGLPKDNLFQVIKDQWGTFLLQLNSAKGNIQNIKSYLMRILMAEMETGKSVDVGKLWILGLFEKEELSKALQDEDSKIDQSISIILSMIRNIAEFPLDQVQSKKFFLNLDVLINNHSVNGPGEMIRALFRPNILSIGVDGKEGLKELEIILLDIKNHLIGAQQLLRRVSLAYVHPSANAQIGSYYHEES